MKLSSTLPTAMTAAFIVLLVTCCLVDLLDARPHFFQDGLKATEKRNGVYDWLFSDYQNNNHAWKYRKQLLMNRNLRGYIAPYNLSHHFSNYRWPLYAPYSRHFSEPKNKMVSSWR